MRPREASRGAATVARPSSRRRDLSRRRAALTLLELLAVVVLAGVFAAIGAARLGRDPMTNHSAQADARRLALDLQQTQRRAIRSGENHYLEFDVSGSQIVGYAIYRRPASGPVEAVETGRAFPQNETVSSTHTQLEFTFEGQALAAYQTTFAGPNQTWRVTVVPVTGAVRVARL